jgi:hypothetical protein
VAGGLIKEEEEYCNSNNVPFSLAVPTSVRTALFTNSKKNSKTE